MPVHVNGLSQFLRHVGQVQGRAAALDNRVVKGVAAVAKAGLLKEASSDAPGLTLSRFQNGKGIKLNAKVLTGSDGKTAIAYIWPTPPGPWYLLERGNYKKPTYKIGRRGNRVRGLGGFLGREGIFAAWGPVTHFEIKPKHTFDKGAAVGITLGEGAFAHVYRHEYIKTFTG